MLLWFFPWNNNNKNDARNLEEVTIFHPIANTTPDPRGIDMPVGCTAAPMQTHSQSGGMLEPQVILDPLETPAPAPGLNGELLPWLPSPVPWGPGEHPGLSLIRSTGFCYLICETRLLHSFFGINHKRILSIISQEMEREKYRTECFVSKKQNCNFSFGGPLINSPHPTPFQPPARSDRPVVIVHLEKRNAWLLMMLGELR